MSGPPVFVISLPGSPRRAVITARLASLGVAFTFIDAIDGQLLDAETIANLYDAQRSIRRLGRAMTRGEIGCALSHREAYRRLLVGGHDAAIILEDDALPHDNFREIFGWWPQVDGAVGLLSLYWGHGIVHRMPAQSAGAYRIHRAAGSIEGNCAYVVRRDLAARFMAATERISHVADWPLDLRHMRHYVLLPKLVSQDFDLPSEIGPRPWTPPSITLLDNLKGVRSFLFLPYLRRPGHFASFYNYYERELRRKIKSRMPWRYTTLLGKLY